MGFLIIAVTLGGYTELFPVGIAAISYINCLLFLIRFRVEILALRKIFLSQSRSELFPTNLNGQQENSHRRHGFKEVGVETENEGASRSVKDLGRRGLILSDDLETEISAMALHVESGLGIFDAFIASLSMILLSEIGDETFIIAALMAMRNPKSTVLSGALTALIVMTVLSTGLGRIVPNLISRKHTNSAATVLYAFFGVQLLYIAWRVDSKSNQKKEMEEEKLESGKGKTTFRRFFSRFCTPIFLESFILTFLAEWGGRCQIATIALATHKNAVGVAAGETVGYTICTSLAVIGGSMLASKISQRIVATIGGFLFLGFSLSSYFNPPL